MHASFTASLAAVCRSAASTDDALPTARCVLRELVERLGAQGARFLLPDQRGRYRVAASYGMDFASRSKGRGAPRPLDDTGVVAEVLRHAGRELGILEVSSPPAWLLEECDGASPLFLLCAQLGPALALSAESATRAREAARVQSLLEAAQASVSSLALKEVLRRAMQAVRDLFEASGVAIWRLDESGALRRFGSLGVGEEHIRAVTSMSPNEGVLGMAMRESRPVAVEDLARDVRIKMRAHLEREGVRSLLDVPLVCRGRTIGALSVYYRAPRSFSAADIDALAGFANQVAAAIDNALAHAGTVRALSEARAQRELLESVVRNAQDGILALDGSGRLVLFSPGCERLTGWSASAALGRPLADILTCSDDGACCSAHAASAVPRATVLPGSGPLPGYAEVHVRTPSNDLRWLGVSTARVSGRRANAPRIVAILRDVTEARQVDELKTAILSTVSHELRTPLTSIRALSEMLAEHEEASADARQMASTINRESERLTRLVGNVLDVARLQAGRMPCTPRPLDLAPLLNEAAAVLDEARRSHRLDVQVPADLPPAWADPDRVRQVLDNLLDNATKYSPAGSTVQITAALCAASIATNGSPDASEMLLVSVLDTGPGVPAGQLEQVFERFHRVSQSAGGSGLGLYLSRALVELMGGAIWAESPAAGGACFRFTLPIAPRSAPTMPRQMWR
jgi:PAS domain S-box-containing protein